MPGWYIHLDVAKTIAEALPNLGGEGRYVEDRAVRSAMSSFNGVGPTPEQLSAIIRRNPNYYALGAIGPDIFFLLPDFKGKVGNFIARLAEWVIEFYDTLDEKVLKPWHDIMRPIEENNAEIISRLTGDLSNSLSQTMNLASGIFTEAVFGFLSRLYDWFGIFGNGPAAAYDDKLFFWSDVFHYRSTNEFARDLFLRAWYNKYDENGMVGGDLTDLSKPPPPDPRYEAGVAFALGWMTHVGTDVTGHPFVNEKAGGPYRLHWQRHHLVENHMDAFVYNFRHGTQPRYNMIANAGLHFWVQFDKADGYKPKYDLFDPAAFPQYPTGLSLRDYFDRKKAFDVDSEIPHSLAYYIMDTMKYTYVDRHKPATNDGMATHPAILAAVTGDATGRPDIDLMHTTYALLFKYMKYTTTDYYKMAKPQPPDVFPNLDPPMPPGSSDDAPGSSDDSWDFWKTLLAIFAWVLYVAQWIIYIITIIPAIVADVVTYGPRLLLYLLQEGLYELWKAFRSLLVAEGFVLPEDDEIDMGLVQLGLSDKGPFIGLLGQIDDVFGGLLGDNPNPPPLSEPVRDPLYPRRTVKDDPTLIQQFVSGLGGLISPHTCDLPVSPGQQRQPSEFLRPWEYPLFNNDHSPIGQELGPTRASPHNPGDVPTVLLGSMPGTDEARQAYAAADSPDVTDGLNEKQLNERWNLGDPLHYALYVMGQLTRMDTKSMKEDPASFNLDADRGYGYKCWDWDRHRTYQARYNADPSFAYPVPCTPPPQFDQFDTCNANTPSIPSSVPLEYREAVTLALHYLKKLAEGGHFPNCDDAPPPIP